MNDNGQGLQLMYSHETPLLGVEDAYSTIVLELI